MLINFAKSEKNAINDYYESIIHQMDYEDLYEAARRERDDAIGDLREATRRVAAEQLKRLAHQRGWAQCEREKRLVAKQLVNQKQRTVEWRARWQDASDTSNPPPAMRAYALAHQDVDDLEMYFPWDDREDDTRVRHALDLSKRLVQAEEKAGELRSELVVAPGACHADTPPATAADDGAVVPPPPPLASSRGGRKSERAASATPYIRPRRQHMGRERGALRAGHGSAIELEERTELLHRLDRERTETPDEGSRGRSQLPGRLPPIAQQPRWEDDVNVEDFEGN